MRLLIDHECAAVAGGDAVSDCVDNVTTGAIITGAVIGGAAGCAAGGVGALSGAVAGAGTGSLVAQVVAEPFCRWAVGEEEERDPVDPEIEDWSANQYASYNQSQTTNYNPDPYSSDQVYAPHQYVADGASY